MEKRGALKQYGCSSVPVIQVAFAAPRQPVHGQEKGT
jgi:hypothetical protein